MNTMRAALSLLIHKSGFPEESDIVSLLSLYREKHGLELERGVFEKALTAARELYRGHDHVLFLCTDLPCLNKSYINCSLPGRRELSRRLGCTVQLTGCHWKCGQAPVIALKIGDRLESFVSLDSAAILDGTLEKVESLIQDYRLSREKY